MTNKSTNLAVALEEGSSAVITRGLTTIEFNASGGLDIYTDLTVSLHSAAPQVGTFNHDGMKCAGISPDTGKPFYVDPADAPGTYTHEQAEQYAAAHGKRIPTRGELNVLFNNRAIIGGFNETTTVEESYGGWYRTSTPANAEAVWIRRFKYGNEGIASPSEDWALRCVRD